MNYIDLFLLVILLFAMVKGYQRGFVYELAVLGAFFLGLYMAFHFADWLNPYILKVADINGKTLSVISFFLMFLGVSIGIQLLAKLLTGLIEITALGMFNRIAGIIFGGLKMLLFLSLIIFFFDKADEKYQWLPAEMKSESKLYYSMRNLAPLLLPVLHKAKEEILKQEKITMTNIDLSVPLK